MATELKIDPLTDDGRRLMSLHNAKKRGKASAKDFAPLKGYKHKNKDGSYRYFYLTS